MDASVSANILTTHRRLHRLLFQTIFIIWAIALSFCYVYGIALNGAYQLTASSPGDALFLLLLLCPLLVAYLFYGLFGVSLFVVMASAFLHIRQRHLLTRLQTLERTFLDQQKGAKKQLLPLRPAAWKLKRCWLQYLSVNGSAIRSLMADIERYSQLWATTLTVYLSGFISLQCYAVYIVFFMRDVPFISKFLFFYGLLEVEVAQFALVHQCAKVARANGAIERVNRRLGFRLSRLYLKRPSVEGVDCRNLLKVPRLSF